MNIGSIKQNEAGVFIGRIVTRELAITAALREVRSPNPRAPKFEIFALNQAARAWVKVGALFELASNATGEAFLNGKIDDPGMAQPLYVSLFRQDDGSYNVVWSRPTRRRDVSAALAPKGDDALPPFPGSEEVGDGIGTGAGEDTADGLGASTAGGFGEPAAPRGRRRSQAAEQPELEAA